MASTNSPSVAWVVGETVGYNGLGGTTTAIPSDVVAAVVSTSTAAPTAAPTGSPLYLADTDLYLWNASTWVGPYSLAT